MALQNQLNQYGVGLIRNGNRVFVYEKGGFGLTSGLREITDPQNLANLGINIAQIPDESRNFNVESLTSKYGIDAHRGKANITSGELQPLINQYVQNQANTTPGAKPVDLGAANRILGSSVPVQRTIPDLPTTPAIGSVAGASTNFTGAGSGTQFTQIVKTPNNPQVYGQLPNGQWIAFNSMNQLPQGAQIQTVLQAPTGAYSYNDYSPASSPQAPQAPQTQNSAIPGGLAAQVPSTTSTTGNVGLSPALEQLRNQLSPNDRALFDTYYKFLTQGGLQQTGQIINPNKQITPEAVAEFMNYSATNEHLFRPYAEKAILPYFQTQTKLAKDTFLNSLGYSTDQILNQEKQLEQTYGRQLKNIATSAADRGFAQSGIRSLEEQQLAQDTQNKIDENRRTLGYETGNLARTFAQNYGTATLPSYQISEIPRVLAGQSSFERNPQQRGLYTLSDSVYQGLVGKEPYQQETDIQNRIRDLEKSYNQYQTAGARSLT